jgi:DNA-binding response OmpR family regulator
VTRILVVAEHIEGMKLRSALAPYGYDLTIAKPIAVGLAEVKRGKADLIILDVARPTYDGYRVLRRVREIDADTPVLMINASADEEDKVRALRLGADHYLNKPIGINELLARIEAILRRRTRSLLPLRESLQPVIHRFGKVEVNLSSLQVRCDGIPVPLRPREVDLLLALIEREGRVISRQELLESVWGYERDANTRTVDNHIAKLRAKLEEKPRQPRHIISVWKRGYRFQSQADSD